MYLVNYHAHSRCSVDAEYSMADMAEAAIAAGLSELCFTDHCDMLDIDGRPDRSFRWEPVWQEFDRARSLVGDRIKLKLGLELGGAMQLPDFADEVLRRQRTDTDFIIGSVHNPPMERDFYFLKYRDRAQCMEYLDSYVDELIALARWGAFDVLGHLSYPLRYMRARDGIDVDLMDFEEQLRFLFDILSGRGRGIELNSSGWRTNGGVPMPDERILRLYRECGGEVVTIGSDAHRPEHIADGLRDGLELLQNCGFSYFCTYTAHEPEFRSIADSL